jgi:hypothetical protein
VRAVMRGGWMGMSLSLDFSISISISIEFVRCVLSDSPFPSSGYTRGIFYEKIDADQFLPLSYILNPALSPYHPILLSISYTYCDSFRDTRPFQRAARRIRSQPRRMS